MVLILGGGKNLVVWNEISVEETGRCGTQDTGSSIACCLCSKPPWKKYGTALLWTVVDFIETKFNVVISILTFIMAMFHAMFENSEN